MQSNRLVEKLQRDGFGKDRYLDSKASLLLSNGEHSAAIGILTSHCFASYLGERPSLINKWCECWHYLCPSLCVSNTVTLLLKTDILVPSCADHAVYMLEIQRLGHNLTRIDAMRLKKRIGCFSGDDTTLSTSKSDPKTGLNMEGNLPWWRGGGPCNRGPPNLGHGPGAG